MRAESHFEDEVARIERARAATGDELTTLVADASEDVLAEVLANPALTEVHLILLLERKGLPARILERIERARAATGDELTALVEDSSEDLLAEVLANPALTEAHLILLLERKGLPARILERIAKSREWMRSYPVKKRVAIHPRTPRLLALPLLRQLYLFDLVEASLLPSTTAEAKRIAEELILAKLPQLPLGQKLTLAKRGAGRIAAALLREGHPQILPLAIDNAFLTEAHVLRVLAEDDLPDGIAGAIAAHRRWSHMPQIRVALVRNPSTPLARVLGFLPDLTLAALRDLVELQSLSPNLREYLRHEMEKRTPRSKAT